MSKKILKNIGASILILWILILLIYPATRSIEDPGFEELKDLRKYQNEKQIKRLENEKYLVFIMGVMLGTGLTLLVLGVLQKETDRKLGE